MASDCLIFASSFPSGGEGGLVDDLLRRLGVDELASRYSSNGLPADLSLTFALLLPFLCRLVQHSKGETDCLFLRSNRKLKASLKFYLKPCLRAQCGERNGDVRHSSMYREGLAALYVRLNCARASCSSLMTCLTPMPGQIPMGLHAASFSPPPPRRRPAPHACRGARSAGSARGKGAGSHRSSMVRAGAAGSASVAGKFSDETTKLTGEPGLREVPAEGCGHAS